MTARRGRAGVIAALLLGSGPLAGPLWARTMQQKFDQVCTASVERLCPAAKASPDAVKACLLTHRDAVDPACLRLVDAAE